MNPFLYEMTVSWKRETMDGPPIYTSNLIAVINKWLGKNHPPKGTRLPCGCIDECDPYAHDTAPDWHGEHDGPGLDDIHGSPLRAVQNALGIIGDDIREYAGDPTELRFLIDHELELRPGATAEEMAYVLVAYLLAQHCC